MLAAECATRRRVWKSGMGGVSVDWRGDSIDRIAPTSRWQADKYWSS